MRGYTAPMHVPSPIRALPDFLINQIAAGEVVERPASIAKELIENALDAGARALRLEVRGGGVELLSLADDGHGIPRDELVLALTRHCTSKITSAEDLTAIRTLGFRGEALASIAAVAHLSLVSRAVDASHGWRVESRPGARPELPEPSPRANGTTVTVRDLFASVPARRQFLRRTVTETLVIQQLLRGLAFCQPDVSFQLTIDDKRQWSAPAAHDERSAAQRWRAVFGAEFARDARFIDVRAAGMRVFGWVGPAPLARAQTELQMLAVNGRLVRDRQVAHGVRIAYGEQVPAGRHPCYALHLELDPADVDVNVHPGKTEVRFKRLREAHDLVFSAVRQALTGETANATAEEFFAAPQVREARAAWQAPETERGGTRQVPAEAGAMARPARAAVGMTAPTRREDALIGERYLLVPADGGVEVIDLPALLQALQRTGLLQAGAALPFPVRVPTPPGPAAALMLADLDSAGCEFTQVAPTAWVLRRLPAGLPDIEATEFVHRLLHDHAFPDDTPQALVRALAKALIIPAWADRADWMAAWLERFPAFDPAPYRRPLAARALADLFARPAG